MKNIIITYTSRAETIRFQKAKLKVRFFVFALLFAGLFSYNHTKAQGNISSPTAWSGKYKSGGPSQIIIGDRDNTRYYVVEGQPKHNHIHNNQNYISTNNGNKHVKPIKQAHGHQNFIR